MTTSPKAIPLGDSATILRERGTGSTVFVLVGLIEAGITRPSKFIVSLVETWRARGEPVHVVLWNTETKRLHLLSEDQWREVSGPTDAVCWPVPVGPGNSPVLIDPVSCGPQDWLVVPEAFHTTPGAHPLLVMDLVLEARRLKVLSAFIFKGTEPLASPSAGAAVVEDHVLYMQALLLADVVLPGSEAAAEDLHDILVGYERAAFVPLIRPIALPSDSRPLRPDVWPDYVRALRAVFTNAADPVRRLPSIYYLIDEGTAAGGADAAFALSLAGALSARGLALIPARWDADAGSLAPVVPPRGEAGRQVDVCEWAAWTAPGAADAPGWLLAASPLTGAELDGITRAVHRVGLRFASLLTHHRSSDAGPGACAARFAALARLDKVLVGSKRQFDDFYRFLLASPDKVPGAEDRFGIIALPTEHDVPRRRNAPKRAAPSLARVVVWIAKPSADDLHALFAAVTRAIRLSPIRLKFTFVNLSPDESDLAPDTLHVALAAIPGAQWERGPSEEWLEALRFQADFGVYVGAAEEEATEVGKASWQGLPCLVLHKSSPTAFDRPGVVRADLRDTETAALAMLKLAEPEWRRALADEALSRPVRSWWDYADDVASALATDRLLDGLIEAHPSERPPIPARFPNLAPRPKLSLCISTYNRGGWVGVNLRNIFRQIPVPRADLEVLVVDNTSTDNTPEIVQPFLSRPDFRYIRNPKNVGLLGNLAVTAQRARGDYIWILGDDDLTRPGTIERVIAIIGEQPNIDLIYMNYGYSSEKDPGNVTDLDAYLTTFNYLEPAGPDEVSTVKLMAAKSENFYTAIYSHVYRRDHGMRAYCQDTSDRIFSTMLSCIPTSYYTLHYMPDAAVYWMGEPALVVNSNVSWQAYGTLFDLEQLPRTWDLAERIGCPAEEVDRRRSNRLWLVELMWREMFEDDRAGNAPYFSAPRVLMRLKHLEAFRKHVPVLKEIYVKAHGAGHPAAGLDPDTLFSFQW
ncbi:glycosyltransferase family 2 protein [Azorhizobium doebereinerae]|uniref:glycosyltransferase family 2 protein n=1 Tax=Azorhizobium doebereinerae TaxID=281091 RepID=UPI00041114A3|nr:glycosyltransferase family 2 protein [Azorhizobium doebereinerae]